MPGEKLTALISVQTGAIQSKSRLTGGDIHTTFVLNTASGQWVIKSAKDPLKIASLKAEYEGLQLLQSTNTCKIPELLGLFEADDEAALLMEYIKFDIQKQPNYNHIMDLAEELANLHSVSNEHFGLDSDNFIGTLPQRNSPCKSASEFYLKNRLIPQFETAASKGFSFKTSSLFKNVEDLINDQRPALIHGDLWHGNRVMDSRGDFLIDPAVSYGIAEMDLAMMQLFGGFNPHLFDAYEEIRGLDKSWRDQTDLYQLYYLLVHLNLFGMAYEDGVRKIVNKYS